MVIGSAFGWLSCVSEVYIVCPMTAHAFSRRRGPPPVRRWAMEVERRLDRLLIYPEQAAATRAAGAVEVEFTLEAEAGDAGRPPLEHGLFLVRSSAIACLDDATLQAVRALPALPSPPPELLGRQVVVRARFGEPAMAA